MTLPNADEADQTDDHDGSGDESNHDSNSVSSVLTTWFRPGNWSATGVVIALAAACLLLLVVWTATSTRRKPVFYQQSLAILPSENEQQGQQFERRLATAYNQVNRGAEWSLLVTESQINGWLASDLPEKFPDVLSDHILDPRLKLSQNEFQIAFQIPGRVFNRSHHTVLISGDAFVTQQPNQIAFRIHQAKCGIFPIPYSWWADQLAETLMNRDISLTWTEQNGDAVALVNLPGQRVIDAVQVEHQSLGLAGRLTNPQEVTSNSESSDIDESHDNIQR